MSLEPVRQQSEDDEKSKKDDDGPAPPDRGWRAFQAILGPKRADQTKGHAARSESVVLGRKSDQLRHAARDACEKPKRKVAGALKNGLSDGAEEQQETKI